MNIICHVSFYYYDVYPDLFGVGPWTNLYIESIIANDMSFRLDIHWDQFLKTVNPEPLVEES